MNDRVGALSIAMTDYLGTPDGPDHDGPPDAIQVDRSTWRHIPPIHPGTGKKMVCWRGDHIRFMAFVCS
ncbi:hypothetical protein GN316_00575 [Xylophilus sp. Kf1]|nr:hypothetical protein [Xylophilus sp. Kf1]